MPGANANRREFLHAAALAPVAGSTAAATATRASTAPAGSERTEPEFRYSLNTSTLRGQKLPLDRLVDIAAEAGYDAIEPWMNEIDAFEAAGGNLADLGKRIADRGLTVESAIGFFDFLSEDESTRREQLAAARAAMRKVRAIGGKRVAAPPVGATQRDDLNLGAAAERYRALLEIGAEDGVIPQLELWGFSKSLGRIGEVAHVAIESGHPDACVLLDVYHIHKGGSPFEGLALLGPMACRVFHVNDYPADPPRDRIADKDRVLPGDGVAPSAYVYRTLRDVGFRGWLSLELFNEELWRRDPMEVAREGLRKTRATVEAALA